nr:hypothetical protein [Tanacetum cinerariifolium]
MSTLSSIRNLFPPLDNLEHTIRSRSRVDPTILNDFEIVTEGNGDLSVPDLRTIEELCHPFLNGEEDEKELLEMGEVFGGPFGKGEGGGGE